MKNLKIPQLSEFYQQKVKNYVKNIPQNAFLRPDLITKKLLNCTKCVEKIRKFEKHRSKPVCCKGLWEWCTSYPVGI